MRDRETIRQEVVRRFTTLDQRRFEAHERFADITFISTESFKSVCLMTAEFRTELAAIRRLCREEYFVVAPDRKVTVECDLTALEADITALHESVRSVYQGNHVSHYTVSAVAVDRYRPIHDPVCHLARAMLGIRPIYRQYIGTTIVPVFTPMIGP